MGKNPTVTLSKPVR